jgi:hypothetical protein
MTRINIPVGPFFHSPAVFLREPSQKFSLKQQQELFTGLCLAGADFAAGRLWQKKQNSRYENVRIYLNRAVNGDGDCQHTHSGRNGRLAALAAASAVERQRTTGSAFSSAVTCRGKRAEQPAFAVAEREESLVHRQRSASALRGTITQNTRCALGGGLTALFDGGDGLLWSP